MPEEQVNPPEFSSDGRRKACIEGLRRVHQRAGEDADRIAAERMQLDDDLREKLQTYQEIKRQEAEMNQSIEEETEKKPPKHRRHRRRLGFFATLRLIAVCLVLLAIIFLLVRYYPILRDFIAAKEGFAINSELPGAVEGLMPDEELGYSKIDFQNAILGETRSKSDLVVMEQDVQVDSQVSQALANLAMFQKTKTVHSFGTGVYTVDLAGLNADAIEVDLQNKRITVDIPHAVLQYINIDPEKTTFEDTERAFFAFGDISLTTEQQQILETSVKQAMGDHLGTLEMLEKADALAIETVTNLLLPIVSGVSSEFTLSVVQADD